MLEIFKHLPYQEIYARGAEYSFLLFLALSAVGLIFLLAVTLRFAYFYFIKTGELFIFQPDDIPATEFVLGNFKWVLDIGIGMVWVIAVLLFLSSVVASFVWPIAILLLVIFGIPLGTVFLLGYRRRMKEAFVQALKGEPDAT